MLCILQTEIRPLQKINPTLFLVRIVTLRTVRFKKAWIVGVFGLMNFSLQPPGNLLENMVTGRSCPFACVTKENRTKKRSTNQGIQP